MANALKSLLPLLLKVGLWAALAGCSATPDRPPVIDPHRVWPPPTYQSSLKFLGVFSSENNFGEGPCAESTNPSEKLKYPISSGLLGGDKIVVVERTPSDIKVIDFPQNKVYRLFGQERPFSEPIDIAVDRQGSIYVADRQQQQVLVFNKGLKPLRTIGSALGLKALEKIVLDEAAGILYLTDSFFNEGFAFDYEGTLLFRFGAGLLAEPHGLAIHPNGNIYVADTGNAKIRIFNPKGEFQEDFPIGQQRFPSPLKKPWDLAFDPQGSLHIVDQALDLLLTCKEDGEILFATGSSKLRDNHLLGFNSPSDIHIDQANQIFIADRNNFRLSIWQLLTNANANSSGFFARFGKSLNLSCREYDPRQAADKNAKRPSIFKVGDAQNVTLERIVKNMNKRDAYKEVLCLGSVKCKSCRSFNNISVETEHIEQLLAQIRREKPDTSGEIHAAEEAVAECRKCNRTLDLSPLLKDHRIRFCLEPREICPPKP